MRSVSLAAKPQAAMALAVVCGVCAAQAARAQDTVPIDAEKCMKLTSPDERLKCFESQVGTTSAQKQPVAPPSPAPTSPPLAAPDAHAAAPVAAAAPAAAAVAPPSAAATAPPAAAATAPPSATPTAAAAAPAHAAPSTADAAKSEQSSAQKNSVGSSTPASQEIVGTVAALSTTVPNAWLITLDNGQVWRQTFPEQYPLRPGQKVTLRPSRWGGKFRLTADGSNGFIQVERAR